MLYYEDSIMLEACHHYINERVFPIMYMISQESAFVRGTGFIIYYNNVNYLITARHVLEETKDIEYKKFAFPIFGQNKEAYSLPYFPYFSKDDSGADFAVVPLLYEEELLNRMFWKPFYIDSFYDGKTIYDNQAVFVNGFPREMQKDLYGDPNIRIGSLEFITKIYKGDFSIVDNYNKSVDIVFEYKEEIMVNGKLEKVPTLEGISGSPLFCIDHNIPGIWSPERNLKIIGLEKAVKTNKYIRATNSGCLKKSLLKLFKSI